MEDRSLSVLQKNDKNLSIDEFKEGSNCTMKWMGRKEYQCTIVKIHGKYSVYRDYVRKPFLSDSFNIFTLIHFLFS